MIKYKTYSIEDTELIYSLLKEKYPNRQIDIEFNDSNKEYILCLTNKAFKHDPEVPVDVTIKVIYGDSITGDTPLLLRKDNKVYIESIESIFNENEKVQYPGFKLFDKTVHLEKEYSTSDYQVWSDSGWVNIKKVIRHKTDKKIYNILTHKGFVKVTEDHSLLTENKTLIKPSECDRETRLLSCYPTEFDDCMNENISNNRAYIYGIFYANGYCYEGVSGLKPNWILQHSNLNTIKLLIRLLEKEYPDYTPIVCDTTLSSGFYTLYINDKIEIVQEYRNIFYDSKGNNKIPNDILNGSKETIQCFFDGYYETQKNKKNKQKLNGLIGYAGLYYLLRKLGHDVCIDHFKKYDINYLSIQKNNQHYISNQIKKIQIDNDIYDYVYDIETESGTFLAGIGDIIVKNTDSIFLSLKYNRDDYKQNRLDTFKLATVCGDNLTHEIFKRPPIEMEFEKVFHPFILLSKKRYIGRKYDNMKDPFEMTKLVTSGIALTRRDYCKMVKKCYKSILDIIMEMNDNDISVINKAIDIYKKYIDDIIHYKIPFDDLIVSALLAKSYKTRPVHVILAEKLKERNENVQIGERIPYIYIEDTSGLNKIKSELGEDPDYAKKHHLKYNRICYLEQLTKPILSFFSIILKDNESSFDDLLDYVNHKMIVIGGKKFKNSDFKLFTDTDAI